MTYPEITLYSLIKLFVQVTYDRGLQLYNPTDYPDLYYLIQLHIATYGFA